MLDAASQREEALESAGDVGFDLLGRHARVEGGNHDDRDVYRWKHVHRHAVQAVYPEYQDEQADHDDEIGVFDCEARQGVLLLTAVLGRRSAHGCHLGVNLLACLQAGAAADHDEFPLLEAGQDFRLVGGFQPEGDAADFDEV